MIYITGDTHGMIDISKLGSSQWSIGKTLTKKDYLIILGDFGLVFYNKQTKEEKYYLEWLNGKPWTTLFIDGNHDNHIKLQSAYINPVDTDMYHPTEMFGSVVGQIENFSIYHLRRGRIYNIDGKNLYCMGGALSIDKNRRTTNIDYWDAEQCNNAEIEYGFENLQKYNNEVDYIISHTCSLNDLIKLCDLNKTPLWHDKIDATSKYFDVVQSMVKYKRQYCGHFHVNVSIDKTTFLYEDIVELGN